MFGFVAKEATIEALLHGGTGGAVALAAVVVGSIGTAAYSARFALGLLGRLNQPPAEAPTSVKPPRLAFVAPAALLAVLTVLLGVRPGLVDGLVESSTEALTTVSRTITVHLAVWHGFNGALALSAIALAAGTVVTLMVAGRRREPGWVGRTANTIAGAVVHRGLPIVTAGAQHAGRPHHGRRPARVPPHLPRGDPAHRDHRARDRLDQPAVVARAVTAAGDADAPRRVGHRVGLRRRRRHVPRSLRRRPAAEHVRLWHGRAVPHPRRPGPRPHPGGDRDAHHGAVRVGPAPAARPVRPTKGDHRVLRVVVAAVVGAGVFVFTLAVGSPDGSGGPTAVPTR